MNKVIIGIIAVALIGGLVFLLTRPQQAPDQGTREADIGTQDRMDAGTGTGTMMDESDSMMDGSEASSQTLLEVAEANGSFTTLVAAVEAAGLEDALNGAGPLTVFAPTDEAFDALPEGTVEELLMPENRDRLIEILTYHVVPGRVLASDVASMDSATTLQGSDLDIHSSNGVTINDARVVLTDIEASNGIIHVIDTVLIPE